MFIQTEATPNPATLKFLPGRPVLETGTLDMPTKDAAAQSPLAAKLFEVPNVGAVFFGSDFIAVTKTEGEWQQLKPAILGAIMEHYMSGASLLNGDASPSDVAADEFFDAKDAETVATIKDLIETRVRPAVAGDGGFMYSVNELATAVKYRLPIVFLVVNDERFGAIRWLQHTLFGRAGECDLTNPDFPALARAFGSRAERVDPAALGDALRRALAADGPTVLELPLAIDPPWEF